MPGRLENKVAIITGASSGIGRATSLAFAREGATVICSDIREAARSEKSENSSLSTLEELEKIGGKCAFVKCDTSKADEVKNLVKEAVAKYGRLDIMMNNAGIAYESSSPTSIWEYPEEWWDATLAVNQTGVFLGTKYAALQMKDQDPHPSGDRGWIINVASVLGLGGTPGSVGYVSSKHGVMGITKTAAWDLGPHRVHVNALCPGYTATSMTKVFFDKPDINARLASQHPFKGLGEAEDLARAAVFLASEDASWVSGIGLPVDGGYSCM